MHRNFCFQCIFILKGFSKTALTYTNQSTSGTRRIIHCQSSSFFCKMEPDKLNNDQEKIPQDLNESKPVEEGAEESKDFDQEDKDFDLSKYLPVQETLVFNAASCVERDREKVVKFFGLRAPAYLSTSQWDRRSWLKKKKFILVDLSGTMHIDDTPTPDAPIALELLRLAKFKILFVTNTTKESRNKVHERLIRIGFKIDKNEIFTSMNATRSYVEEKNLRPMFLISPDAMEDFDGISTEDPNAVVIGLSPLHFENTGLTNAVRLILEKDAEIVAIHKARSYQTKTGMSLGPGAFVAALEFATDKKAKVLGKPDTEFFMSALKYIGCSNPEDALMIGDDIRDDVLGAMIAGATGILVKTGKYTCHDEQKILPQCPDFTCKNFSEAVNLIIETVAEGIDLKLSLSVPLLAAGIGAARASKMNDPENIL